MKPEDLNSTNFNKKEAAILCYLLDTKKDIRSRKIEHTLELRQPEVSIALKNFRGRGWIGFSKLPTDGKGRPEHSYYLKKTGDNIIGEIIADLNNQRDALTSTIESLTEKIKGNL